MKIRIKGDYVRLRLTRTEVETFCTTGSYQETTHFGDATFCYALKAEKDIDALRAAFKDHTITVYFPDLERRTWANSDRVGYQNTMELANGGKLTLLVEKDFVCLDETIEDQSDNYPNPLASKNT